MKKQLSIYTDGACKGNPGPGGWGAVMIYQDVIKEISGAESHTTNNRMELSAVIESIRAVKLPSEISLYTDSVYVKNGIEQWSQKWYANGWRTSSNKSVLNQDLWKLLWDVMKPHQVKCYWVRGHSGDKFNQRADELARGACGGAIGHSQ